MKESRFTLYLFVFALLAILVGAALYANWDSFKATSNDTIQFIAGLIKVIGIILVAGLASVVGIYIWKIWQSRNVQVIRPGRYGDSQAVLDKKNGVMYLLPERSGRKRQQLLPEPTVITGSAYQPEDYMDSHNQIDTSKRAEIEGPKRPQAPEPFDLADVTSWQPNPNSLLLAALTDQLLSVPLDLAWHIILAGPTGGGKTNILRLLLMQLVKYHDVYLINPHYAPTKATKAGQEPEDWRPIQKHLAAYPDRQGDEIRNRLIWAVAEIDRRATREEKGDHAWQEHYIFIAIDEYPEVKKRCPEAPDLIATIVRRGRHYKVILINTSQDMLIKTVGGSSGDRAQYNTVFNVGCDDTSARALKVKIDEVPENALGIKGLSIIRAKLETEAITTLGRVPYVSNAALYKHLGQPSVNTPSRNAQSGLPGSFPLEGRKTTEEGREGAQEASGSDIDPTQLDNPLMLKRFLNEAGKMRAKGMSIDAILKEYGLPPGGRNNQNLKSLLDTQEEEAGAETQQFENM